MALCFIILSDHQLITFACMPTRGCSFTSATDLLYGGNPSRTEQLLLGGGYGRVVSCRLNPPALQPGQALPTEAAVKSKLYSKIKNGQLSWDISLYYKVPVRVILLLNLFQVIETYTTNLHPLPCPLQTSE